MANQIPIKIHTPEPGLAEFQTGDTIAVEHGGTGASSITAARLSLDVPSNAEVDAKVAAGGSGTAMSGWRDLISHFSTARGNGTEEPSWSDMGNGIYAMKFVQNDELFVTFHVPHDYKVGTLAYPHIHWCAPTALSTGDTIEWEITYIKAKGFHQGESFTGNLDTITLNYVADGTEIPGEHMVTECNEFQSFDLGEIDSLIMAKVKLNDISSQDNKVFGIMCDIHYESDGMLTNEKAPLFTKGV